LWSDLAKETSYATPAGSDHACARALRATVFESGLGTRTTLARGGDAFPWSANRDGRLRVMGLATERRFTNCHQVLKRSTWSGRPAIQMWSDRAIARITLVLLALFSLVIVLALRLSQGGQLSLPVTAWYQKAEPTFGDCLALVRRHLWCAPYVVNATTEPECVQFPPEAFELLLHGLPLAA
jgi:hypothetical protein